MPKVSVIIPTYNCEKYLANAIDSALQQTYQDFEVIIIDDGSSDGTKELVKKYVNNYSDKIHYVHQQNKGVSAARNNGIKIANGEYIAFLDADDLWISTKLMDQMKLLEKDRGLVLVFTDMQQTEGTKILYESFLKEKGYYPLIAATDFFSELVKKALIYTSTVVVKKQIFDEVGVFNETYKVGEDHDLWLRIAKRHRIGFLARSFVVRRLHDFNATRNKQFFYEEQIRLLKGYLKSDLFNKMHKRIFFRQLSNWYYELGYYYFSRKEYKRSLKWFVKSIGSENGVKSFFYFIAALFPSRLLNILRDIKQNRLNIHAKG